MTPLTVLTAACTFPARLAGVAACMVADTLRPPTPVRGWDPPRFTYDEED